MSDGLRAEGLTVNRGDLTVCRNVTLTVPRGEITVLLGANGAGKTTLLDGIAGVLGGTVGAVTLGGRRIDTMPMHRRAAQGLAYVEQGRSVFTRLTVAQNLGVVDHSPQALTHAFTLFPRLEQKRDVPAGLLSGGEQQMLMIARALATGPKILLVDQLSLGLAPRTVHALMQTLASLADSGMGILLVEQFVDLALRLGTTAHIMQHGKIVRSELCSVLLQDRASIVQPYFSVTIPSPQKENYEF
jgi:branched-chain amino acid transport system ATP-binding protein